MTFDDAYCKLNPVILRYSGLLLDNDTFEMEEATSKAFSVLFQKWESLISHDEQFLKCWLIGTVKNSAKEVKRQSIPVSLSLHDEKLIDILDRQMYKSGMLYDAVLEQQKYEDYIRQIEQILSPANLTIFHRIIVDNFEYSQIAKELHMSENAVRIKWIRLKRRLKPLVEELTK